jgi:hypothetical protein
MNIRRTLHGMFVLAAVSGSFASGHSSTVASRQPNSVECRISISGAERPTWIPAQNIWEETFRQYAAGPAPEIVPGLASDARMKTATLFVGALERTNALRQSLPPSAPGAREQVALERELLIADTILDARDDVSRQLSREDFEALNTYAEQRASRMAVSLPIAGRVVTSADGSSLCELEVVGKEHPELIPEYQVWRSFLRLWAKAAKYNLAVTGQFSTEYLETVRRTSFRMPHSEIASFLRIAISSTAELDALPKAEANATSDQLSQRDLMAQRSVMNARHTLLRALTVDGWRAVLQRFDKARVNTKFWYRTAVDH